MAEFHSLSELVASRLLGLTIRQLILPPVWLGLERDPSTAQFEGLQFEAPFQLVMGANVYDLDPAALYTSVGAEHLFGLYGRQVTGIVVSTQGQLEVTLNGGIQLAAPAHNQFESWSLVTPAYGAPSIACSAGGRVLTF